MLLVVKMVVMPGPDDDDGGGAELVGHGIGEVPLVARVALTTHSQS